MNPKTEAVARAIAHALGLNPDEAASPPAPGYPGLKWTQFATAADAALSEAEGVTVMSAVASSAIAVNEEVRQYYANARAASAETSAHVASIAARGIASPESLTADEIQAVCGSALAQR